jgi:hypothetical protein
MTYLFYEQNHKPNWGVAGICRSNGIVIMHTVKKAIDFPVHSPDVTYQTLLERE